MTYPGEEDLIEKELTKSDPFLDDFVPTEYISYDAPKLYRLTTKYANTARYLRRYVTFTFLGNGWERMMRWR